MYLPEAQVSSCYWRWAFPGTVEVRWWKVDWLRRGSPFFLPAGEASQQSGSTNSLVRIYITSAAARSARAAVWRECRIDLALIRSVNINRHTARGVGIRPSVGIG